MGACCGKLPEAAEFLQSFEAPPTRCLGAPKSEQLIFVMPEKFLSLSGQDAPIEDKSGSTLAILDGKNLSLRDRAVLMDAERKPIACIREQLFTMRMDSWRKSGSSSTRLCRILKDRNQPTRRKTAMQPLYAWGKVG